MIFGRRRRRRGIGLGGILVIGGLLYGTGAGGALVDGMQGLPSACSGSLSGVSPGVSRTVCGIAGQAVGAVTSASTAAGSSLDAFFDGIFKNIGNSVGLGQGSAMPGAGLGNSFKGINLQSLAAIDLAAITNLASSEQVLANLMRQGPSGIGGGSGASGQFQAAIDSLAIGQRYLSPSSGVFEPNNGISWLQQGAGQQEYGLLPQLTLGNMFLQGGQGVPSDPNAAVAYYSQALGSLQQLQGSSQPDAQKALAALPVAPAQLQQELIAVIRAIKPQ